MTRPIPRRAPSRAGILTAVALAILLSPAMWADSPAVSEPPADSSRLAAVDLKASRLVGFAPMTVVLTGNATDEQGLPAELGPEAAASLTVVSASLSLPDGAVQTPVMSAVQSDAAGVRADGPISLSLLLSRPGKYTVRFLLVDGDRERLSNPIELRVM